MRIAFSDRFVRLADFIPVTIRVIGVRYPSTVPAAWLVLPDFAEGLSPSNATATTGQIDAWKDLE
jgi:hypothetical protein